MLVSITYSELQEVDGLTSRPNHVPYEKYQELLEETSSLKMQALHREEEIQTLKGMLAQKDKETVRLKDQLLLRDKTISKLRALVEFAWTEFDSAKKRNINPKASAIEEHEKETIQEINGTASIVNEIGITNQDGDTPTSAHVSSIKGEPPSLLSTFNGPQPPPAEAKIPREAPNPLTKEAKQDDKPFASAPIFYVGPILSVSNSKGHSLPPPPPRPPPPPPRMEANIVGAIPTPVREFHIAPCPPPPRPSPPPPPPPMEANIVGATWTPVRVFRVAPVRRMEANITGATQTPVRIHRPNNTETNPSSSTIRVVHQDGKPHVSAPIPSVVKP